MKQGYLMPKLCTNCVYHKRAPVQHGQQMTLVSLCTHPELCNPVDGSPIPALMCRQEKELCGFTGRGFLQKQEDSLLPPTEPKSKVIVEA